MNDQRKELAFELSMVERLCSVGWIEVKNTEWDVDKALFCERATVFLQVTQPETWERISSRWGEQTERIVIEHLESALSAHGSFRVLRNGFRCEDEMFEMSVFKPSHDLNWSLNDMYAQNDLTVTRQARCHPGKNDTVDLLFALNGIPVATCELKNPLTEQNWEHAVLQYQEDRDPDAPLFRHSKRTLFHFAADPDEIHVTTRLQKNDTIFLPFNRGSNPGSVQCGAGNPVSKDNEYATEYFWTGFLQKGNFLDLIASFIFEVKAGEIVFPRYHQWEVVTELLNAIKSSDARADYLIQHSAGSGKTNSIALLVARIASAYLANGKKAYDCVVVITDRRYLDRQLQAAVRHLEPESGAITCIDENSKQLAAALVDGTTRVIITTLQKFPFVQDHLFPADDEQDNRTDEYRQQIENRRYAIVIDEAHSSQTGESAQGVKELLGNTEDETDEDADEIDDWQSQMCEVMASHGPQSNLSFFAFTATPKSETLEIFGVKNDDGSIQPFHVYSMRQAVDEGYILDPMSNYTTHDNYLEIATTLHEDPDCPVQPTVAAIKKHVMRDTYRITKNAVTSVEHFMHHVKDKIGGKAKGMVVADSRYSAVQYKQMIDNYIKQQNYSGIRTLVAFSGTVEIDGENFTEEGMNRDIRTGASIKESALTDYFKTDDFQILIVAKKYQTGFNEPLLQVMYIDTPLSGIQAVQTLSRANRCYPNKSAPIIMDYRNDESDIRDAFAPYYDASTLQVSTNPEDLGALKDALDDTEVYQWSEVGSYAKVYFLPLPQQSHNDHVLLHNAVRPASDRFKQLEETGQIRFRRLLQRYLKLYDYLRHIANFGDEAEMLAAFGRDLLGRLPTVEPRLNVNIEQDIVLKDYRAKRRHTGRISLTNDHLPGLPPAIEPVKPATNKERQHSPSSTYSPLSEIIYQFNLKHGINFSEEEQQFLQHLVDHLTELPGADSNAQSNNADKFCLSYKHLLEEIVLDLRTDSNQYEEIAKRCLNDDDYGDIMYDCAARAAHMQILTDRNIAARGSDQSTYD